MAGAGAADAAGDECEGAGRHGRAGGAKIKAIQNGRAIPRVHHRAVRAVLAGLAADLTRRKLRERGVGSPADDLAARAAFLDPLDKADL